MPLISFLSPVFLANSHPSSSSPLTEQLNTLARVSTLFRIHELTDAGDCLMYTFFVPRKQQGNEIACFHCHYSSYSTLLITLALLTHDVDFDYLTANHTFLQVVKNISHSDQLWVSSHRYSRDQLMNKRTVGEMCSRSFQDFVHMQLWWIRASVFLTKIPSGGVCSLIVIMF